MNILWLHFHILIRKIYTRTSKGWKEASINATFVALAALYMSIILAIGHKMGFSFQKYLDTNSEVSGYALLTMIFGFLILLSFLEGYFFPSLKSLRTKKRILNRLKKYPALVGWVFLIGPILLLVSILVFTANQFQY